MLKIGGAPSKLLYHMPYPAPPAAKDTGMITSNESFNSSSANSNALSAPSGELQSQQAPKRSSSSENHTLVGDASG